MHVYTQKFKQTSQHRDDANSAQSWATTELIVQTVLLLKLPVQLTGVSYAFQLPR